jgi:hypothetical protein
MSTASFARESTMQDDYPHRFPRDLDLAMRFLQVDSSWYESSWYESYWPEERKPQPASVVARNLPTILSSPRLACDRVASVRRALLAIVLRTKLNLNNSTTVVNLISPPQCGMATSPHALETPQ